MADKGHPPIALPGGSFNVQTLEEKLETAIKADDGARDSAIATALDDASLTKVATTGDAAAPEGFRIGKVRGQDGETYTSLIAVGEAEETKTGDDAGAGGPSGETSNGAATKPRGK